MGVSRNASANGVDLAWPAAANATGYQVWRDTAPYFAPAGSPSDLASATNYTDRNVLGNPATNTYYVITGLNPCAAASGISNRVGSSSSASCPDSKPTCQALPEVPGT